MKTFVVAFAVPILLGACVKLDHPAEPTRNTYSEIEASGLQSIAPYPEAEDVCVSLKATKPLEAYQQEGRLLIACPKHEKGALEDRRKEGARVVGHARHWTVLSAKN